MRYTAGYKYQLCGNEIFRTPFRPEADIGTRFIELTTSGILTVKDGYANDGCSGPTLDTRTVLRG